MDWTALTPLVIWLAMNIDRISPKTMDATIPSKVRFRPNSNVPVTSASIAITSAVLVVINSSTATEAFRTSTRAASAPARAASVWPARAAARATSRSGAYFAIEVRYAWIWVTSAGALAVCARASIAELSWVSSAAMSWSTTASTAGSPM